MKTTNLVLLDPDPATPLPGSGGASPAGTAALAPPATEPTPGSPAPQAGEPAPPTPPPAPAVTADTLAEALKKAGVGGQPSGQPQAPRTYTQNDFDRAFNVVRPNAQQLQAILAGGDAAVIALTELLHATAKQAVTMSAFQLADLQEKLSGRFAPIETHYQSQVEDQLRGRFFQKHPELKPMEAALNEVVKGYKSGSRRFSSEDEAFKAAYDDTVALVKKLIPNWDPKAQPSGGDGAPAPTPSPKMPTLAKGGGSGATASTGNQGGKKSPGMAVFQ